MVNVNRCKWVKYHGLAKAKECISKWVKCQGLAKANGLRKQMVCESKWFTNANGLQKQMDLQ